MSIDTDANSWVKFNPLTQCYNTRDGTSVAAELMENVTSLADVLYIQRIRSYQRAKIRNSRTVPKEPTNGSS